MLWGKKRKIHKIFPKQQLLPCSSLPLFISFQCLPVTHMFQWKHFSLPLASGICLTLKIPLSLHLTSLPTHNFSSVQLLSCVQVLATPWIAAHQASLSTTNSQSLLKLMSIESVMPSNHLILCRPLLLLLPIPPSIRDFSNELTLCIRWPKYWSFSFKISPSKKNPGLISFRMDLLDPIAQIILL